MKNAVVRAVIAASVTVTTASFAGAQNEIVSSDNGFYRFDGFHNPSSSNYVTGYCADCSTPGVHRSFFVFDLSDVDMLITDVHLQLAVGDVDTPDESETINIYAVTTPVASLVDGSAGVAAFTDLGDGDVYGSISISGIEPLTVNTFLVAPISAALGGTFVIGGALTTLSGQTLENELFFGGSGPGGGTLLLDGAYCPEAPEVGCSTPGKSSLKFKAPGDPAKASFGWKWSRGNAALGEFGAPLTTTPYALCVYKDGSLAFHALVNSGSGWSAAPSDTPKKFKFKPESPNDDGVSGAGLVSSTTGKAKLAVKGKGASIDLPIMPFNATNVTVQLRTDSLVDHCWQSSFTTFAKDEATSFAAKQ